MPSRDNVIVAVDFDGTLVGHDFPRIGPEVPKAVLWVHRIAAEPKVKIMLWTMRSDGQRHGDVLAQAVAWCRAQMIPLWAVNKSPGQSSWSKSKKQYAHLYIDDAAVGTPLREHPSALITRPVVDWDALGPEVLRRIRNGVF